MDLKPGSRWKSVVCDTEVVIVRPPSATIELYCGGHAMTPLAEPKPEGLILSAAHATGSFVGKRYEDPETGLEALCSKSGAGSLAAGDRALTAKEAKKLPSSD